MRDFMMTTLQASLSQCQEGKQKKKIGLLLIKTVQKPHFRDYYDLL